MALCSREIVRSALRRKILNNDSVSSSSGIYEVEQLIRKKYPSLEVSMNCIEFAPNQLSQLLSVSRSIKSFQNFLTNTELSEELFVAYCISSIHFTRPTELTLLFFKNSSRNLSRIGYSSKCPVLRTRYLAFRCGFRPPEASFFLLEGAWPS